MAANNPEIDSIKAEARRDYEAGVATFKQLSEKYSIKEGTIKSWASRENWVKGDRQDKRKGTTQPDKQPKLKKKVKVATKNEIEKDATQSEIKKDATKKSKKDKVAAKDVGKDSSFPIQKYIEPKQPEKLTEKEELFCLYFAYSLNATQSYLKAFGCSYNAAKSDACKLLTKSYIRAEVNRIKKIKYKSIMLTIDDLVEKHMRIAFTEITDLLEFSRVEVPVMGPFGPAMVKQEVYNPLTNAMEMRDFPITKTINEVRIKDSFEVDGGIIKSISQGKDGIKIEPYDAQKSMDWLERYFQWNPMDRHKMDFDRKRLALQEQELTQKSKTGSAIQEAIANAQNQVQTLADLLNGAKSNRNIENFEKEGQ